jgi:hypothetical protein
MGEFQMSAIQLLVMQEIASYANWYIEAMKRLRKRRGKLDEGAVILSFHIGLLGAVVQGLRRNGLSTEQIIDFIRTGEEKKEP